jgi:ATP-dependent DNA ligase
VTALRLPIAPQLARTAKAIPHGEGMRYEPKLDGFRAICGCGPDRREIHSRGRKPLTRYFPEVRLPEVACVLDGELVITGEDGDDFGLLGQRIHPAASRIALLAETHPARLVAFDLLERDGESLLGLPFVERRARLEVLAAEEDVEIVPCVSDPADAERWLHEAEGVIAKACDAPYRPGERAGMWKIKRVRTMECVVMGWRPGTDPETVGSLILGAYEADGSLRPVGHAASFTATRKRELREVLAPLETGGRGTGDPSRWSGGRDLEWVELRPELVVEVSYDHASNGRIRHGARIVRFRPDRRPEDCSVDQLG